MIEYRIAVVSFTIIKKSLLHLLTEFSNQNSIDLTVVVMLMNNTFTLHFSLLCQTLIYESFTYSYKFKVLNLFQLSILFKSYRKKSFFIANLIIPEGLSQLNAFTVLNTLSITVLIITVFQLEVKCLCTFNWYSCAL